MQPDKTQTSNSFLHRTLKDGAKSFCYRSGVRLLLGIADNEAGQLVFSPTLPLAGFNYASAQFTGEPYIAEDFPRETGRSVSPGGVAEDSSASFPENIQRRSSPLNEVIKNVQSRLAEGKEDRQNPAKRKSTEQQNNMVLEYMQEKVPVGAAEKPEKLDMAVEKSRIEIPGVSAEALYFPALSPARKDDIVSNPPGAQDQEKVLPAGSDENFVKLSQSEVRKDEPFVLPMTHTVGSSATLERGKVNKKTVAPLSAGIQENTVANETEERREFYSYRAAGAYPPLSRDIASKSNQEAAERIEQLRQAVHELTSKKYAKTPEQERTYVDTQSYQPKQTAPPLAQPVVIIKRYAHQVRTSCAFWERSYLSRFHLRPLR